MVQEEDEDVTMLAAPVTLRDGGVKERPQEEATKQVVSQWQLRPIYKAPKHRKLMMRHLDEISTCDAFSSSEITTGFSAPKSDAASRTLDAFLSYFRVSFPGWFMSDAARAHYA